MGIPKFFRWVSERYPLIVQDLKEEVTVPEVGTRCGLQGERADLDTDNLYLDMNGIIHACTHPNDGEVAVMSEAEQMLGIFRYIERVFNLMKPKKMMFMAIDGITIATLSLRV